MFMFKKTTFHCFLVALTLLSLIVAHGEANQRRMQIHRMHAVRSAKAAAKQAVVEKGDYSITGNQLVQAMARQSVLSRILNVTYEGAAPQAAIYSAPLQGFPRIGNQYVVLSTGDARDIKGDARTFLSTAYTGYRDEYGCYWCGSTDGCDCDPYEYECYWCGSTDGCDCCDWCGSTNGCDCDHDDYNNPYFGDGIFIEGGTPDGYDAYDVATLTLRIDLSGIPADARLVFRYKFLTEEAPDFWNDIFQDFFTAYILDANRNRIQNIAILPNGLPYTLDNARPFMNQVQGDCHDPEPPFPSPNDTKFNAATGVHTTDFALSDYIGQVIFLEFQVGDAADAIYDSAVMIDGLEIQYGAVPDFFVDRIEFNQVTQSFEGDEKVAAKRLVAGKPTGVRVFAKGVDNAQNPQQITAELHMKKDGAPIAGSPFAPVPSHMTPVAVPERTAQDADGRPVHSLNFRIPASATGEAGDYAFYVHLNPDHEVDEADYTNNRYPLEEGVYDTVTFHPIDPISVLPIRVTIVDDAGGVVHTATTDDDAKYAVQRSNARLLPQAVNWLPEVRLDWNKDAQNGDLTTQNGRSALLAQVLAMQAESKASTAVGVLPRDTDMPANGVAYVGMPGALSKTLMDSTLIHEIIHNMLPGNHFDIIDGDRNHDNTTSGNDGLDPLQLRLRLDRPNILHPFGHDNVWISPTTYQAVFESNGLNPSKASKQQLEMHMLAKSGEFLRIIGWMSEEDALILRPFHTVSVDPNAVTETDPDGEYYVSLLNDQDEELSRVRFNLPIVIGEEYVEETAPFMLHIPRPAGLGEIAFFRSGLAKSGEDEKLGGVEVSDGEPSVAVIAPEGGETLDGVFTIRWAGGHTDEPAPTLFYTVSYSHDDGQSWRPLASDIEATEWQWDTSNEPGADQGLIRVSVSDGVNTATDTTLRFSVAKKAPVPHITSPNEGDSLQIGQVVNFVGGAEDLEDGDISGDSLVWISSLDGEIGTGSEVDTSTLSEGFHIITLQATDSDGQVGEATIGIDIIDTVPPAPTDVQISEIENGEVTVSWTASASEHVAGYIVYWGTSSGNYGDQFNVGYDTSFTLELLSANNYYIAVRAYDNVGNLGAFSDEGLVSNMMRSPSGGVTLTERRPAFMWSETLGATWYHVLLYRNGVEHKSAWVNEATWTPAVDLPAGAYQWWVRAWGPEMGMGGWSEEAHFSVAAMQPVTAPIQTDPSGDVTDTRRPAFMWDAVEHAVWYRVVVVRVGDGNAVLDRWTQGTTLTPDADLPVGDYHWRVVAWGPDGFSPWSEAMDFSIPANVPGTITLLDPQGEQAGHDLTYRWEQDENAMWYRLWIGQVGAGTWHDGWHAFSGTGTAEVELSGHPEGDFTWWLHPWGPDGFGPWSGPMHFSTPDPAPAQPTLISPVGEADPPVTLEYESARAAWFRIYVQRVGHGMVHDGWTQDTTVDLGALPAGDYAWWVGAWNAAGGRVVWSSRGDFSVR